jgi:hypothetical protein
MATPVRGTARAYAVWLGFQIHPGKMSQFMPLMLANPRALQPEPGCRRFDVLAPEAGGGNRRHYRWPRDRMPLPGAALTPHIDAQRRDSSHFQPIKILR